jgi:hypothetical protein
LAVAGFRNANGIFGSGNGVVKLKKYLLIPKIASFVTVGVGDQRQFSARFFGVRIVSTKFGVSGKIRRPAFAESPNVFCEPCA